MTTRDTVVVGASAGGVEALRAFVGGLPPDLPASVLVVLHVPADSPSVLPAILNRSGSLPASRAEHGEVVAPGRIYVAPPDCHLLLDGDTMVLSRGPKENGHRPSVDPLFRSAAQFRANRVVAVVLSGSLDDGTAGCLAVRARGGLVAVQDPEDALYDSMPRSVIAAVRPDVTAPSSRLGALVAARTFDSVGAPPPLSAEHFGEQRRRNLVFDVAAGFPDVGAGVPGTSSGYSCPDCQGTLFEFDEEGFVRFRCRVGHAWSIVSLLARQDAALDHALWMALRNFEEKIALCNRMAELASARGNHRTASRYHHTRDEALEAMRTMRSLLLSPPARVTPAAPEPEA